MKSINLKMTLTWALLVNMLFATVVTAETLVTLDPQTMKQFSAQVEKMNESQRNFVRSKTEMQNELNQAKQAFKSAEAGSEEQHNAANRILNAILDQAEVQLAPLEKFSVELEKMQAINARAAETAKPDEDAMEGNARDIQIYNEMVMTFDGWDKALASFKDPKLQRNREDMKKAINSMRNQVMIAKANGNRLTYGTFKEINARLIDYRLLLDGYVKSLIGMVSGILDARQSGQINLALASLDQLLGDIDGFLIPGFIDDTTGAAINLISGGGPSQTASMKSVGASLSYQELLIKE